MPNGNEVFAAFFRFDKTVATSTPTSQRGLTPPANWGNGVRNSNFQWAARNPDSGTWSSQTEDPLLVGAANGKTGQYRASGNPVTINVVGYTQNDTLTSPIVQVSAFTTDNDQQSGNPTYIAPPFAGYVWGESNDNSTLLPVPPIGTGNMVTFSPDASQSFSLSTSAGTDGNNAPLYGCPVISFVYDSNLRGQVASRGKIFIDVAIYLTLGSTKCYDDPEMEIDLGS